MKCKYCPYVTGNSGRCGYDSKNKDGAFLGLYAIAYNKPPYWCPIKDEKIYKIIYWRLSCLIKDIAKLAGRLIP